MGVGAGEGRAWAVGAGVGRAAVAEAEAVGAWVTAAGRGIVWLLRWLCADASCGVMSSTSLALKDRLPQPLAMRACQQACRSLLLPVTQSVTAHRTLEGAAAEAGRVLGVVGARAGAAGAGAGWVLAAGAAAGVAALQAEVSGAWAAVAAPTLWA